MQWRPSAARLEARAILRSMSPLAHRVDARARAHVGASDADGRLSPGSTAVQQVQQYSQYSSTVSTAYTGR